MWTLNLSRALLKSFLLGEMFLMLMLSSSATMDDSCFWQPWMDIFMCSIHFVAHSWVNLTLSSFHVNFQLINQDCTKWSWTHFDILFLLLLFLVIYIQCEASFWQLHIGGIFQSRGNVCYIRYSISKYPTIIYLKIYIFHYV